MERGGSWRGGEGEGRGGCGGGGEFETNEIGIKNWWHLYYPVLVLVLPGTRATSLIKKLHLIPAWYMYTYRTGTSTTRYKSYKFTPVDVSFISAGTGTTLTLLLGGVFFSGPLGGVPRAGGGPLGLPLGGPFGGVPRAGGGPRPFG